MICSGLARTTGDRGTLPFRGRKPCCEHNGGELRGLCWLWGLLGAEGESIGGLAVVPGLVAVLVFLFASGAVGDPVAVAAGPVLDAVGGGGDVCDGVAAGAVEVCGALPAGGVVAGGADGDGEGDAAGADAGAGGGAGPQRAQGLADDQEREQFLAGQVRGPGAEGESGAAQPGLQLAVAVLAFPPLPVQAGQRRRRRFPRVEQCGDQPELLADP